MKHLLTGFAVFVFYFSAAGTLLAQNKDSIEGDYEALVALYNSTQGNGVEILNNTTELPDPVNATYPYMYMIDGEIHYLSYERQNRVGSWENAGSPWKDTTGWTNMTPETMGDAVGIEVDANGRVVKVDMQKITTELYGTGLISKGNNLVGILPAEIANLKKLTHFNIKQNFFYGEIPYIGTWINLERLSLGGQYWELDIEQKSGWWESDHRQVNYDENPFTTGVSGKEISETNRIRTDLPSEIGSFQNLDLIEIRHQYLTGTLPAEWGDLQSVRGIFLSDIRSGPGSMWSEIPESWGNLNTITHLYLENKNTESRFHGSLPTNALSWNAIINIALQENDFTGSLPAFRNLQDLRYFNIANNEFTGEVPWESIFNGNNSNLNKFKISHNNFSGELPATLPVESPTFPIPRTGYPVADFSIGTNNFTGTLPEWSANFLGLQIYGVDYNNFTGTIPSSLFQQQTLKTVYLRHNSLSGLLPDLQWASHRIQYFTVSNNNFEGEIPDSWISMFQDRNGDWITDHQRIGFKNNNLSGRVPDWIMNNPNAITYAIQENEYVFSNIVPVYADLKAAVDNFLVFPQKPFGESKNRTMPEGGTVVFDLGNYHADGNQYQWIKDGQIMTGETNSVLEIQNVSANDEGEYILEVTNTNFPELDVHESEPIYFQLGADDGENGNENNNTDDGNSTGNIIFPDAPAQIAPVNNSSDIELNPAFYWSDIGADYYILHVSRLNPSAMFIDVIVADTTYMPKEILDDDTIHDWRVRGVKDGEMGDWSEIRRFTTADAGLPGVAGLVSPAHFAQNVNPQAELAWEDIGADSYEIRLINKLNSEIFFTDVSASTVYMPAEAFPDTTEFIWQVKSVKDGVQGAWGPRWEFSTGVYTYSVKTPLLIAPDTGSEYTNLTPIFEWSEVDATHYVISVSKEQPSNAKSLPGIQNETTVIFDETTDTIYMPDTALDPETRYYWRIQAVKNGEEGEWSEIWEFTTPAEQLSVSTDPDEKPFETSLAQNYPNPFNPSTQIEFTLSAVQDVSLRVYDMAGRQVATLIEGVLQAGKHSTTFSGDNLASGIYFYRFVSDTHQFTRKMTLVK